MAKHRLLVADDSVTIQKVVNLTFAEDKYEVITVSDGDAAIAEVYEIQPSIVLADVSMPGLNGFQVCETIKSNPNFSSIPVILLVGSFENFNEEEAKRVGANDFLTKPFQSIRELADKVSALLENPQMQISAFSVAPETENETPDNYSEPQTEIFPEAENFGDMGMDDEMIQTEQFQNPLDESRKYQSRESQNASTENNAAPAQQIPAIHFSDTAEYKTEELVEQYQQSENLEATLENYQFETAPPHFAENTEERNSQNSEPEVFAENYQPEAQTEVIYEHQNNHESSSHNEQIETVSTTEHHPTNAESLQLSDEQMDLIANRVIEKLSDKIVKEVAAKIAPQIGELVVKRMFEENSQT